jgi:hypothetical protein
MASVLFFINHYVTVMCFAQAMCQRVEGSCSFFDLKSCAHRLWKNSLKISIFSSAKTNTEISISNHSRALGLEKCWKYQDGFRLDKMLEDGFEIYSEEVRGHSAFFHAISIYSESPTNIPKFAFIRFNFSDQSRLISVLNFLHLMFKYIITQSTVSELVVCSLIYASLQFPIITLPLHTHAHSASQN